MDASMMQRGEDALAKRPALDAVPMAKAVQTPAEARSAQIRPDQSVRGEAERAAFGPHFGRHQALRAGPEADQTRSGPGRNSVRPKRRSVSMCTKMSGVPSPRVRKPKPRSRLNHLTCARSSPLVGVTVTWVRGGGICAGCTAVDSSIERMRKACRPFGRCSASHDDARALIGGLEAVAAQARDVQQHVGHAIVRNDEAVALGDIEPFDDAGDLDDARRLSSAMSPTVPGPARFLHPAPLIRSRPTP